MPREKWSIKKLEACLQELEGFNKPKVKLEQYATPPHIAAIILHTIDTSFNDLRGKLVADLGCGTGSLTIGSILHDTKMVYGFDIDNNALCTMLDNIQGALSDEGDGDDRSYAFKSCRNFDLIQVDVVSQNCASFWKPWSKFFDTVIMNPPFGTKQNSGLDMLFLKRAIDISCGSVYSLHKTSTRSFIQGKIQQWGLVAKPIAQIRYNLENTYRFHKRSSVDIDVDLWQIQCS